MHARALLRVVRAALMRVLAVAQIGDLRERRHERLGESLDVAEPACDRRLVRGGRRERLGGERAPRREREARRCSRSSCARTSYCSGRQTGAQCAKFFAAPRSIDGPPMSIISTASSSRTP